MSDELIAGLGGALIGSVLSGLLALVLHRMEQTSLQKDELRKTLMVLIELREEANRLNTTTDPQALQFAGLIINNKKFIYLEAAESLVRQIPKHVSFSEYVTLATELWNVSNFKEAEKLYLSAVKATKTGLSKMMALRHLAEFYFSHGPQRDFDKGRKHFQEAVDAIKNDSDAYSVYSQGYTYERWGLQELFNNFKSEGSQKLDRARKYYEDLPAIYPLRNHALTMLEYSIRSVTGGASVSTPPPINTPPGPIAPSAE